MNLTVEPFYRDGQVKYFVGNGTSKKLVFNTAELEALRSLIGQTLGANRVGSQ